jgi:transcriptional coactivator p15 (PC4)
VFLVARRRWCVKTSWVHAADARMRRHGTESMNGFRSGFRSRSLRQSARPKAPPAPNLPEPIVIAEWWKNRGGQSIRAQLTEYEGRLLIDVRSWFTGTDGVLKPGKGFAASIRHLPRLHSEIGKALNRARELRLIDGASA